MSPRWTLWIDGPRAGPDNMAIDAAMLDHTVASGEPLLRCYQWDPHCLSFGRHEPALRRYDADRIRRDGLACVRRPTGGRAVWHARELTYAVTAPVAQFGGMREAYAAIHALLARAIDALGARTSLAPRATRTPGLASGPCFALPVGGEVLIGSGKVAGSAQLRMGDAFLQHGSLLLEDDQQLVRELAGLREAGAEIPLARALERPVEFTEAAEALAGAAEALDGAVTRRPGLPDHLAQGAGRHSARFHSDAWTWQR
jgi:lipoate-protein ligase A